MRDRPSGPVGNATKPNQLKRWARNWELESGTKGQKQEQETGNREVGTRTFPERTKSNAKALRIYNKDDFNIIEKDFITNIIKYKRIKFKELINSYADVA